MGETREASRIFYGRKRNFLEKTVSGTFSQKWENMFVVCVFIWNVCMCVFVLCVWIIFLSEG